MTNVTQRWFAILKVATFPSLTALQPMALYHFHIEDNSSAPDPEPVDLPSIKHARIEAARTLGELIKGEPDAFWENGTWRMTVTDATNLTLFEILIIATDAPVASKPAR